MRSTRERVSVPRGSGDQLQMVMGDDGDRRKPVWRAVRLRCAGAARGLMSMANAGYRTNPAYDSLLAKLIVHSGSDRMPEVLNKAYRALCEFHIAAPTNLSFCKRCSNNQALHDGR